MTMMTQIQAQRLSTFANSRVFREFATEFATSQNVAFFDN